MRSFVGKVILLEKYEKINECMVDIEKHNEKRINLVINRTF
jgi:hypothetical protein